MKIKLLWPFILTMLIPLAVAYFVYPNTHLPPEFGVFPPVEIGQSPGFNLLYFSVMALGALGVTLLFLFPSWFGFKKPAPTPPPTTPTKKLPWWFYVGAVFMVFFWWLMWSRSFMFGDLIYYAFSPMWWGFIVMLDGIVYYRTGGKSLLVNRPKLFLISALFSVFGWSYFEYFDYFVLSNWYYPNGHMSEMPRATLIAVFLVAYSTVWTAIFEWYTLLNSFPRLVQRYSQGLKIPLNGTLLLIGGALVTVGFVALPHLMFWGIWIGPMAMLVGQLMRLGVWTPYVSITQGNWSPALLIALSSLLNGFLWEMWNYGSSNPDALPVTNPNYWIYDVPYVNVIHIFSEMPLLGYFGYLPFGLFVWVMYIWAGKLFGFSSNLDL